MMITYNDILPIIYLIFLSYVYKLYINKLHHSTDQLNRPQVLGLRGGLHGSGCDSGFRVPPWA